jgi:hypothetical protein
LLTWLALKKPPPAIKEDLSWLEKIQQLDIPGAIVLLGSTTCLNLALQWGGIIFPWSHPNVFGCLIGFALLLLAFILLQVRGKERYVFYIAESLAECCSVTQLQLDYSSSHSAQSDCLCIVQLHDACPGGYRPANLLLAHLLPIGEKHEC